MRRGVQLSIGLVCVSLGCALAGWSIYGIVTYHGTDVGVMVAPIMYLGCGVIALVGTGIAGLGIAMIRSFRARRRRRRDERGSKCLS